jgi:hypothetical protein
MGRKLSLRTTLKRTIEAKDPIIEIIGEDTELPYLWIGNDGPGRECYSTIELKDLLKFLKLDPK